MSKYFLLLLVAAFHTVLAAAQSLPKPTLRQLAWQPLETTAFLHFTVNT